MDFGLKDKIAVVLAASSGLGYAAAESLANEGCKVAVCSRNDNCVSSPMSEVLRIIDE